ncbi:MAG: hypothetical protein CL946_09195 [Ectothiorhodospiraceae bacterium]|nr:hypothetical protein [Ectothiorhodospiraceae bacterium]
MNIHTVTYRFLTVLLLAFSLLSSNSYSQISGEADTVRISAGPQYQAGWLHRLFFGSHWRDLWTTEFSVPVLDLETYAGGLTPVRLGGGMQTKSLRFLGADGVQYKFRSIDKDPTKVLPQELQQTLAAAVIQDQVSSANPLSALVVVKPLRAVGVLQAEPVAYVLPDSPRLGEYREQFARMLGLLEVHPDELDDDPEKSFAGSEKIVGTFKMFEKVEGKRKDRVDAKEYLKARFMDLFLGDWDRHIDQWRWAAFERNDTTYWRAIPRDRDQAFARFNGLLPSIASVAVPQLNHFSDSYPSVQDLSWSGRSLDRRILPALSWSTWDSIRTYIVENLTDDVIIAGVKDLPPEYYDLEGEKLTEQLRERKDAFPELVEEYYHLLANEVDIYCTEKDDFVHVQRLDDVRVRVEVYKEKSDEPEGTPHFRRDFHQDETAEIRIYMLDGKDYALVEGEVETSILVRIIGGEGKDEFENKSRVRGDFLHIVPFISDDEDKTRFYDHGDGSTFITGPGASVDQTEMPEPESLLAKYEPKRDWGHSIDNFPYINYSSDAGLILTYGYVRQDYAFRAFPYSYQNEFWIDYAPVENKFDLEYAGTFLEWIDGSAVLLNAQYSSLSLLHFYGFGNETQKDEALEDADYYDSDQKLLQVHGTVDIHLSGDFSLQLGAGFQAVHTEQEGDQLISDLQPFGYSSFSMLESQLGLTFDTRDFPYASTSGLLLSVQGRYFPEALDLTQHFAKVDFDARTFLSAEFPRRTTLALRVHGARLFYDESFPFIAAAYLGGKRSLRGFRSERFAGDGAVAGAAELRTEVGTVTIVAPITVGVLAFTDAGKVFLRGEESDLWHTSVGGGLWLSVLNPSTSISASIGVSEEYTGYYVSLQFPW